MVNPRGSKVEDSSSLPKILNPYRDVDWETFAHHKANLHTHTTQSDGHFLANEVIEQYQQLGYSILAISDHNYRGENPITWPWNKFGKDAKDLGMLAIEACEIAAPHDLGSYFNSFNGIPRNESCNLIEVLANKGLAVFFHPGFYDRSITWYLNFYRKFSHLIGLEVINQRDRYPHDRELWDQILTRLMPQRPVWGFSNDDMHRTEHFGFNWNVFLLSELTEETFREAMQKGQFYFSIAKESGGTPPIIEEVMVDNQHGRIELKVIDCEQIVWLTAGEIVAQGEIIKLNGLKGSEPYVRAHLFGKGGETYTQPFGLMFDSKGPPEFFDHLESFSMQEDLRGHKFKNTKGPLSVYWANGERKTVGLSSKGDAFLTDKIGNSTILSPVDGVITSTIIEEPIYLEGELARKLVKPQFELEDLSLAAVLGEKAKVGVKIKTGALAGKVLADQFLREGAYFNGDTQEVKLQLLIPKEIKKGTYNLNIDVISGEKTKGRMVQKVNVIEPIAIALKAVPSPDNWRAGMLNVEIVNNSSYLSHSGMIYISFGSTKESIKIIQIAPGEKRTFLIPMGEIPPSRMFDVKTQLNLDCGVNYGFSKQIGYLVALRAEEKLKIDGKLTAEKWGKAIPFVLDRKEQVRVISDWAGPKDLSVKGYLMWDDDYLYLAAKVIDGIHFEEAKGKHIYIGDSIQFGLDLGKDSKLSCEGWHNLGLTLNREVGPISWRWDAPTGFDLGTLKKAKYAVTRQGTETNYEIAIPWSDLLSPKVKAELGLLLGFAFVVMDNDGEEFRGWMEYKSGIAGGQDPKAFGEFYLGG